MAVIYDIELNPDCINLFNADKLVQVGTYYIGNKGMSRNTHPGNKAFNKVTKVEPVGDDFILHYGNNVRRYLESTTEGCDYRLYNTQDKETANLVQLFVEGSDERDLYSVNLGVELEHIDENTTIVHNRTLLNNKPWQEANLNTDLRTKGFQWYFHGVEGGDFIQGDYIANDGQTDFNKGNGDRRFCIITRDPNVPILTKDEINDEGTNGAHYYLDYVAEKTDSDFEMLTFIFYSRTKDAHRGSFDFVGQDVWLTLDELFPNNK